jgi:hypothetical protein
MHGRGAGHEQISSRHNVPIVYLTAHADDTTLKRVQLTGRLVTW